MKTIDIQAKEWFDKVYGNSYFSGIITIDYGMPTEKQFKMPFQYGYEEQYIYEAAKVLGIDDPLWRYCKENNITLKTNKQTNCKKKEL